jgi:hypothetical protein
MRTALYPKCQVLHCWCGTHSSVMVQSKATCMRARIVPSRVRYAERHATQDRKPAAAAAAAAAAVLQLHDHWQEPTGVVVLPEADTLVCATVLPASGTDSCRAHATQPVELPTASTPCHPLPSVDNTSVPAALLFGGTDSGHKVHRAVDAVASR